MLALPAIRLGDQSIQLPLADATATILTDLLLSAEPDSMRETVVNCLGGDPALATWAVYEMSRRQASAPCGVDDVVAWLTTGAARLMHWPEMPPVVAVKPWRSWVQNVLAKAYLAATVAAGQGPEKAEAAYLQALCLKHETWPAGVALDSSTVGFERPTEPFDPAFWRGIEKTLAGEAALVPDDELAEMRTRALAQARRWAAKVDGAGRRLYLLAERLARVHDLEHAYQETLQRDKLDAMAELAAGAGHEINNPLAIIGGRAQLLLRGEQDAGRRHDLAVIAAQVRRAYDMIADLRLFSRPAQPEPEVFDLSALVDEVLARAAEETADSGTTIRRVGHEGPLEIEADRTQLAIVLGSLCRNAHEAIPQAGHIEVGLSLLEEGVEIRVTDDGEGITAEQRRHLFDPFYSARQAGRGLGFGLSKCWSIVTNHGGSIDVESTPGEGATFLVRLPIRPV